MGWLNLFAQPGLQMRKCGVGWRTASRSVRSSLSHLSIWDGIKRNESSIWSSLGCFYFHIRATGQINGSLLLSGWAVFYCQEVSRMDYLLDDLFFFFFWLSYWLKLNAIDLSSIQPSEFCHSVDWCGLWRNLKFSLFNVHVRRAWVAEVGMDWVWKLSHGDESRDPLLSLAWEQGICLPQN